MLVNQAFPLAVFVMALHSSRFYLAFCISVPTIGISATCRTAVNSRERATYFAVCRNLNTRSVLPVKCTKALVISSVVL